MHRIQEKNEEKVNNQEIGTEEAFSKGFIKLDAEKKLRCSTCDTTILNWKQHCLSERHKKNKNIVERNYKKESQEENKRENKEKKETGSKTYEEKSEEEWEEKYEVDKDIGTETEEDDEEDDITEEELEEFRKEKEKIRKLHKEENEEEAKKKVLSFLEAAKAFAQRCELN